MKLVSVLLLGVSVSVFAATEEEINKRFPMDPGGSLVVDVNFGGIEVATNNSSEVVIQVWRKITRSSKRAEEDFLRENPVQITKEDSTVTVRAKGSQSGMRGLWGWRNRNEGKYTITVPSRFNANLRTAGGSIHVDDVAGEVKASTSGGGLRFKGIRGPINGDTSGGGINVAGCEGTVKIHTSGGGIEVANGKGELDGDTSGGSVRVKDFTGPARVRTSGGGIHLENLAGKLEGSTSGGSINATLSIPVKESVKLSTSGGGITLALPENSAFDLDAETSAGSVSSDLPVTVSGKLQRSRLKGPVNGGGQPVVLRTSAGSIHVKKLAAN